MNKKLKKTIYWLPRILMILFICFISMFAFDMFDEGSFWKMLIGFFIHMLPTFALVILLTIAWKWEKIGGILIILLGIIFTIFFNTYKEVISFLLISMPVFIVGGLFLWSWWLKKK
ncbi:hypothetical protein HN695_07965 [Candidatus Woesearchaeota archaeon]|jgi:hypothetical protein|nr:hypothetical protein [Candidatus Woesearchaeota archaeon]MBT5272477.1 hypothetical protein [Candidatus Woesearchaeota archaeon]MBT6041515.1 hypothetical protein [Candidatus Woesearchaeota archaeon]MBT6336339.1 hypothetical protein [Candidatus Woesearchaeota archaeon]MBT7928241.1 hypothetical protein [Candidatus Woesearchaeota archaeon]